MRWLLLISSFVCLSVSAQENQGFQFLKPMSSYRYLSEDIGITVDWSKVSQESSWTVGGYFSAQSSAMGAGIWYHASSFATVQFYPNVSDTEITLGGNAGVSLLLLELKAKVNFAQNSSAFVPGVGLGINRTLYGMMDYYVQRGDNELGWRIVLRMPIFTRYDKNLAGYTPAYN
jgi:hypothetical protein